MWIMYVCFSFLGLLVSLAITRNRLEKTHEEAQTGLEAEKAKKLERDAERAERRRKRASKAGLQADSGQPGGGPVEREGNES